MSSADRDARIAEIADDIRFVNRTMGFLKSVIQSGERWSEDCRDAYDKAGDAMDRIGDYSRTALSREEEAKKDAERLDALEDWYVDSTGEPFIVGPDARGNSFVVDPCGASDVRVMIDAERAARSVSLSENG